MEAADAQELPAAIQAYLDANREFRLVEVSDVPLQEEFQAGRIRPYAVGDTNLDGEEDYVAVLVRENRFSVAVFHGALDPIPSVSTWLIKDEAEVVQGVAIIRSAIVPIRRCIDCDGNPFYRWIGWEYGKDVYLPGRTVCIRSDSPLREQPIESSDVLSRTTTATEAIVLEVGRVQDETRWYQVRLDTDRAIEGYLTDSRFLRGPGVCVE